MVIFYAFTVIGSPTSLTFIAFSIRYIISNFFCFTSNGYNQKLLAHTAYPYICGASMKLPLIVVALQNEP